MVVIKTGESQWTKAAMTWAFRKTEAGLIPILTIERFVTYRDDLSNVSAASDDNIMLFAGFAYDFDIGQVVPVDQGGDLAFTVDDKQKSIQLLGEAKLWGVNGSQLPETDEGETLSPTDHAGVLPTDFFRSLENFYRWPLGWSHATENPKWTHLDRHPSPPKKPKAHTKSRDELPHHRNMPNSPFNSITPNKTWKPICGQKTKSAMAGISSLAGQTFGFYATREKE